MRRDTTHRRARRSRKGPSTANHTPYPSRLQFGNSCNLRQRRPAGWRSQRPVWQFIPAKSVQPLQHAHRQPKRRPMGGGRVMPEACFQHDAGAVACPSPAQQRLAFGKTGGRIAPTLRQALTFIEFPTKKAPAFAGAFLSLRQTDLRVRWTRRWCCLLPGSHRLSSRPCDGRSGRGNA